MPDRDDKPIRALVQDVLAPVEADARWRREECSGRTSTPISYTPKE